MQRLAMITSSLGIKEDRRTAELDDELSLCHRTDALDLRDRIHH